MDGLKARLASHIAHGSVLVYSVQRDKNSGWKRSRHAREIGLSVAGAVPRSEDGVLRLEHNVAVGVHQQRAERMVAVRARSPRQLDGGKQVALSLGDT